MSAKAETPGDLRQANQILSEACAKALHERDQLLEGEEILWNQIRQRDETYQVLSKERDQWRDVAAEMEKTLRGIEKHQHLMPFSCCCGLALRRNLEAYDALAKLSEKP